MGGGGEFVRICHEAKSAPVFVYIYHREMRTTLPSNASLR